LNTVIFLAKEISSTQVTHGNAFMEWTTVDIFSREFYNINNNFSWKKITLNRNLTSI
jgi:hypothetical protein